MQGTSGRLPLEVIPGTQQREKEKAEICQHPESEESWPPVSVCLHSLQEEVLPEPEPVSSCAVSVRWRDFRLAEGNSYGSWFKGVISEPHLLHTSALWVLC